MNLSRTLSVSKFCGSILVLMVVMSSCSSGYEGGASSRNGASSKVSSVTMPVPDKLKPYMGSGKIDAWSLSIVGGECANGGQSFSIKDKFGVFDDSKILISEKITTGCAYTFILSLGKANSDKSKLEAIYLTNDIDGKRTELSQDKTKDPKIPVNIVLYFTEDGQKTLGGTTDSSLSPDTSSDSTAGSTPNSTNNSNTGAGPQGVTTCYKGDNRICNIEFLIAQKTNAYRRQSGLRDLEYDPKVAFVSRDWSAKQAASGGIGHGGFPSSRVAAYQNEFGAGVFLTSENVAYNFCNNSQSEDAVASAFVQQWWNSSGHRRNMLGGHAAIGVGIVVTSGGACYGTQLFR